MAITTWAATTGDWDDSKFSRAWDGPGMSPAKGDLTLSSSVPVGGIEYFISPGVANLEIVQSYEWDQLTSSWIDTAGDWSSGPVPQVAVGTGISPDKADLTFTAYSPRSGIMYDFRITAPTLTLTGQLPVDGTGFVISPDNATLTILQTYTWDNYGGTWAASSDAWDVTPFVPSAVETGQNQPDAGSLTLTGTAPDRTIQKLWYVPVGSLAVTGFVPTFSRGHIFIPDNASLSGFGTTSWADASGDWASSSDTWGTGTLTPVVGVTYIFSIDSAGNLVFTPYEPGWPLVSDPTYISEIIMS
jgi:hypothetical protein|tara:strand:+ start:923 stop:1825 length:903 start_codon:yes stop_codon:yes gene_type:complete